MYIIQLVINLVKPKKFINPHFSSIKICFLQSSTAFWYTSAAGQQYIATGCFCHSAMPSCNLSCRAGFRLDAAAVGRYNKNDNKNVGAAVLLPHLVYAKEP